MELVKDAVAGSQEAFATIYATHKQYISNILCRICPPDDLEDDVQTAFIRIYGKLASYAGEARLRTWMHRVAVNSALAQRRTRLARGAQVTVSLDEIVEGLNGEVHRAIEPGYEDTAFENNASRELVSKALYTLSEFDQSRLSEWLDGYGITEIAHDQGWPISKAKSDLHRAKKRLRKAVETLTSPGNSASTTGMRVKW